MPALDLLPRRAVRSVDPDLMEEEFHDFGRLSLEHDPVPKLQAVSFRLTPPPDSDDRGPVVEAYDGFKIESEDVAEISQYH
jgi:hypothetical protein